MRQNTDSHNPDPQETEHMLQGADALIRKSRKSLWESYRLLAEARVVLRQLPPHPGAGKPLN